MCRNYLLTGSTGFIGRHILYELVHAFLYKKLQGKIYLLIRAKPKKSPIERIRSLFNDETPDYLAGYATDLFLTWIECIEGDLSDQFLTKKWEGVIPEDIPLSVIHTAGTVNLGKNGCVEAEVYRNNYIGTFNFIKSLSKYTIKFTFISTAFSSGLQSGVITNELIGQTFNIFRNPYERYKAVVEKKLDQYCNLHCIELQILRPSIVCGRLIDSPLYYTSKFDVFYGFAKYFWTLKNKSIKESVRIMVNMDTVLNIIPVDYVAKAIVRTIHMNIKKLNIIHKRAVPAAIAIKAVMDAVEMEDYSFVHKVPSNFNNSEKAYYRIVHSSLGPYLTSPKCIYDCRLLDKVMIDTTLPDINSQFENLIYYAIRKEFREKADTVQVTNEF